MTVADDASIRDEADLWRRIPHWHFIHDENLGRWRPSSAAFADDPDGHPMSVVLAEAAIALDRGPDQVLMNHEGFALAAIIAGLARACGLGVIRDPLPDEPAHALVIGPKPKSIQRRLAKSAAWVIAPPQNA